MNAGSLRHRVRIEALTVTQNPDTGAQVETWLTFSTVWAAIVPASGREFIAAQASQSGVNTRITIRHLAGVVPSMRVVHGPDIYNIKAVLPDPTFMRHLNLMCEIGVVVNES